LAISKFSLFYGASVGYLHVNVTRFSDTGTPLARLSLARWNYVKTVEFFDPFLSPLNNPVIVVFS